MFHRWAALVLVLALCAMTPKNAAGQGQVQSPRGHSAKGRIGQNYPNPFNPDTKLAFDVGEDGCVPGTGQYKVTMQLQNVLGQIVAEPTLWSSSTSAAVSQYKGRPIHEMLLPCGSYIAYWNAKIRNSREAASGVYGWITWIDNDPPIVRKIYYKK